MANPRVGQYAGEASSLRHRKRNVKTWIRQLHEELEQAQSVDAWLTRKLRAAEQADRLGRAWLCQSKK